MDKHIYSSIPENQMLPFVDKKYASMFQQENDPKQKSLSFGLVSFSKKIIVMQRPAQSTVLNPIEGLR